LQQTYTTVQDIQHYTNLIFGTHYTVYNLLPRGPGQVVFRHNPQRAYK